MNDHLDECPEVFIDCYGTLCDCEYSHFCICDALRACEARVTALATPETVMQANYWYEQGQRDVFAYHPEWTVTDMCKPDCLPCQRLTELITEREKGFDSGERDMLAKCIAILSQERDKWFALLADTAHRNEYHNMSWGRCQDFINRISSDMNLLEELQEKP